MQGLHQLNAAQCENKGPSLPAMDSSVSISQSRHDFLAGAAGSFGEGVLASFGGDACFSAGGAVFFAMAACSSAGAASMFLCWVTFSFGGGSRHDMT